MKYYLIAGEASGDLHASNLIKSLSKLDSGARFRGWGGRMMAEAGCTIVRDYTDTAIMGFITVLTHLGTIRRNIKECCDDIAAWAPDVVILVDYAGFNLRIASFAKRHGLRVFYYISPKLWAWNTGRVKRIKRDVDAMFAIFPFETEFYKKHGFNNVYYAGNPLADAIASRPDKDMDFNSFTAKYGLDGRPLIALVAGSRRQELKYVLPEMLKMVPLFPDYRFVIAGAPGLTAEDYAPYIKDKDVPVIFGDTYQIISQSRTALVTSGTATLETALLRTPQVVCYSGEGGRLYYLLFKLFVKVKYISLVNLVTGRETVKELLMQKMNSRNLYRETDKITRDGEPRSAQLADYDELSAKIGAPGVSDRFAKMMLEQLNTRP